jgi:hypothetical protein
MCSVGLPGSVAVRDAESIGETHEHHQSDQPGDSTVLFEGARGDRRCLSRVLDETRCEMPLDLGRGQTEAAERDVVPRLELARPVVESRGP